MPGPQTPNALAPDDILSRLKQALLAECQAVADYGAHAAACEQPDVREALETLHDVESEHAKCLARRITSLGGKPYTSRAEAQPLAGSLAEWLESDLSSEQWAIVEYARLVATIMHDDETADLMTELLVDEIRHAGWLKSVLREIRAG